MKAAQKLRVLFVDDELRILDGIRRQFRSKRKAWDIRFATSAAEALRDLSREQADVVISDMRMPKVSGAELLREVQQRWPGCVRFILSGQTDHGELIRDIGAIHQFIQKPCTPDALENAVARTMELASLVESEELRAVAASIHSLPVTSAVHQELLEALEDEDGNADKISRIVERDVGLSAKLLQMLNSAFFGLPRRLQSVKDAVVLMGTHNLKLLAVTAQVFNALSDDNECADMIRSLWNASTDIGALASALAHANGQPGTVCDAAWLAGTLSLIGRAIFVRNSPERYQRVQERAAEVGCKLHEAEMIEYGVPQHMIGAYAAGLWAFDDAVVESIARQINPDLGAVRDPAHPLPYVHLARTQSARGAIVQRIEPAEDWVNSMSIVRVPSRSATRAA